MIHAILHRDTKNEVQTLSTLSVFKDEEFIFGCLTLEPKICVANGVYTVVAVSPTIKIPYYHYQILGVIGHSGICIHRGNFFYNTKLCVLVGNGYKDIDEDGNIDVIDSKICLDMLKIILPIQFTLVIK